MASTLVPEAKKALEQFKTEAANEVGVSLNQGYNGDLTARQAGSIGATYKDIIDIMQEYGAVNACNMDGGSSSVMMYRDTYGKLGQASQEAVFVNVPSLIQSKPRRMPNFWMVRAAS